MAFPPSFALPDKWVDKLARSLERLRRTRQKDIEKLVSQFGDHLKPVLQYYVEPRCQPTNPWETTENIAGEPLFLYIIRFCSVEMIPGENCRHLFVLGDPRVLNRSYRSAVQKNLPPMTWLDSQDEALTWLAQL